MSNDENPNWFTKKKVQVPRTAIVVDEIKCSMCDFAIQPKTSNRDELKGVKEHIMLPHAKKHTIEEFLKVWDEYDEIWDDYSFERYLFSTTKRHSEETGEFWERTIDPKISVESILISAFYGLLIIVVILFAIFTLPG